MKNFILNLKYHYYSILIFFLKIAVYIENKIEQYNNWRLEQFVKGQIAMEQMYKLKEKLKEKE